MVGKAWRPEGLLAHEYGDIWGQSIQNAVLSMEKQLTSLVNFAFCFQRKIFLF